MPIEPQGLAATFPRVDLWGHPFEGRKIVTRVMSTTSLIYGMNLEQLA